MTIFLETLKMVSKVFRANKLRTILTMLGIIIGIFSVTMIFAVSDGTKDKISKEFQEMDQTSITLTFNDKYDKNGMFVEKTVAPFEALSKITKTSDVIRNVTVSSPRMWQEEHQAILQENLENGIETQDMYSRNSIGMPSDYDEGANQVNAVGYDFFSVRDKLSTKVAAGRLFSKFDEENKAYFALVSDQIAAKKFGSVQNAINKEIYINHVAYKVIGVLQRNAQQSNGPWDDQYVYPAYILHSTTNSGVTKEGNMFQEEYILKVKATNDRDQAKQEIKTLLSDYMSEDQYNINMGFGDNQEVTNNIMDLITLVFAGIAGLSLIVGGIGIMNIMLVSVNERIKEIGIRQALGARRKHILMQFLVEAIVLTLLAGVLGMLFAQGMISWLNTQSLGIVLTVNIKIMLSVVLFCSVVGIIFGFYPANKASKLNIADALRYE